MMQTELPKVIWMFWHSGLEQAPEVVKLCYESWQARNPEWEIRFLDAASFQNYVRFGFAEQRGQRLQALSDLLRINLLAKYGGVWVDATCYCQLPLDAWLPGVMTSGFFAFERRIEWGRRDPRYLAIWFLASCRDNYLTAKLCDMANAYWRENPGLSRRPHTAKYLHQIMWTPRLTRLWFSYPVTKLVKAYPYMWPTFLFTRLIQTDAHARQLWRQTPKHRVDEPHNLQKVGLLEPLPRDLKDEIDAHRVPVYKLSWRYQPSGVYKGCVIDYLFSRRSLGDKSSTESTFSAAGNSSQVTSA